MSQSKNKDSEVYKCLERYVLSSRQQLIHGYPRPDPSGWDRAIINTDYYKKNAKMTNLSASQRSCDRCDTVYQVNGKGVAVNQNETCTYHWGKSFQNVSPYSCCNRPPKSEGCAVHNCHISNIENLFNVKGFARTTSKATPADGNHGVYALDCEMCYTTEGSELTRVTVVSSDYKTVYETLVKPENPILDHNTRFSGISEKDLQNVKTTLKDVQAALLNMFSDKTILIGHGMDADFRALRLIHDTVVDTSVVFPHSKGQPYKRALRTLCDYYLSKTIQKHGHNSMEDAVACMELMMYKIKPLMKN